MRPRSIQLAAIALPMFAIPAVLRARDAGQRPTV